MTYHIFFSPTGITEKAVRYAGKRFPAAADIDLSKTDLSNYVLGAGDFVIAGVPSFGGRVPQTAAARFQQIKGDRTPAVLLVTYGGRAYEDTLKELRNILEMQGFICIGAAAMVAEHSIIRQIETGRPDAKDYSQLDHFIIEIKKRLQTGISSIEVPSNMPYKEYRVSPMEVHASGDCVRCGACAKKCPVAAIPLENPQVTDHKICISCMRCVSICPFHARSGSPDKMDGIYEKLKKICTPNKPNEFL